MASTNTIIFEQPLNEHIRICLRLEYLFAEANHFSPNTTTWDSHFALVAILEILSVIDRPDLKSKLGQALNQYISFLAQLEKKPNIDQDKLKHTLIQLEAMKDYLHSNQGKIGQELRDNEFLFAIQQRLYTPAGTCNFSIPAYHLWLELPETLRKQQLLSWLKPFSQIKEMIDLLLKLVRESSIFHTVHSASGFYQTNLDPAIPYQMIRIKIPSALHIYPEISVGRHRLTIHFFELNIQGHAKQTQSDLQFELACCKI